MRPLWILKKQALIWAGVGSKAFTEIFQVTVAPVRLLYNLPRSADN